MGIKHANRIEECLRQRLRDDPELAEELAEFFDENREERFFVKNLERVQGDERDAIILSIGYGKNARGALVYRFGPLLLEGGERRLNVAVTRAKNRITLVSSFTSRDMDPERSAAEGVKLMRHYLQYVESGGTNLGDNVIDKPALNPFEVDVRDTLTATRAETDRPVRVLRLLDRLRRPAPGATRPLHPRHRVRRRHLPLLAQRTRPRPAPPRTARTARLALPPDLVQRMVLQQTNLRSESHRRLPAAVRTADEGSRSPSRVAGMTASRRRAEKARSRTVPATTALPAPCAPPMDHPGPSDRRVLRRRVARLARWIRSDDIFRTEDELLHEMMHELGFQRRGKNVVARSPPPSPAQHRNEPGHHNLPRW